MQAPAATATATASLNLAAAPPAQPDPLVARLRAAAAHFWLAALFFAAERAPWLPRVARRPFCRMIFATSPWIRRGTLANARRILPSAGLSEVTQLARRSLASFYLFCCDVGRSFALSREQLQARVESIHGHEHYDEARAPGRGVIVVTAHMGSFEVGMAALRRFERNPIHVVFRRDRFARFERQRSALRRRLGVEEAPVDQGWTVWVRLREALLADHAVVLQGDRVMPGQKGEPVPFLGGTLMLPTGPVKLALATGAPIVPIFSVRNPDGSVRVFIEEPIDAAAAGGAIAALDEWARVLECYVQAYPDQWLMLEPALVEDHDATPNTDARDGADGPATE